jgi:hypothetical protein
LRLVKELYEYERDFVDKIHKFFRSDPPDLLLDGCGGGIAAEISG